MFVVVGSADVNEIKVQTVRLVLYKYEKSFNVCK